MKSVWLGGCSCVSLVLLTVDNLITNPLQALIVLMHMMDKSVFKVLVVLDAVLVEILEPFINDYSWLSISLLDLTDRGSDKIFVLSNMDDWNGDSVFLDHILNIHVEKLHCSIWCFVSTLDGSVVEPHWWNILSEQPCSLDIDFIGMHLVDVSLSMLEEVQVGVFGLIASVPFHKLSLSVLE